MQRPANDPVNPKNPEVTVVIPHFHDLENLDRCLSALGRQTFPRFSFEIIVADNDSPEGKSEVERVIAGRARLIIVRTRGAGPARNGGAAEARGKILAFTDSDCRPEPKWLEEGLLALTQYDFVGGRMVVAIDNPLQMTPTEAFESVFAFDNEAYVKRKAFTVTANLLTRREVFDVVGEFAAGISEDVEWSQRAIQAGYRIGYAHESVVGHPARSSWAELLAKWRRINAETFALKIGRRWARQIWLARSLTLPISAFVHTPKVLLSHKISGARQRLAALITLHRLRWWRAYDSWRLLTRRA